MRPKPRWLLRDSEFPISVTDQGRRQITPQGQATQGPHRSGKVSRAAQGPHRPMSGPQTSSARDRDSCRRVTRPPRCAVADANRAASLEIHAARPATAAKNHSKSAPAYPSPPSPIHPIPHHNSFASQAGNHRYEISRNAGIPRSPRWAPYRAPLVGHASSAVLATCIHHRPPHRSRKSETVSNTGRHRQTCGAVNALGGTIGPVLVRTLCCKRGAVTVSLTPVTASCRPDMRWAARQLLNRERVRAAADAPSPRP